MTSQIIRYPSANGSNTISARIWRPEDGTVVRGVVQIAHGMVEHGGRYEDFAAYLVSQGFVAAANDHAGHGESHGDTWGYMGGHLVMVRDMRTLFEKLKKEYPQAPYFLLGHSMGSFLARAYAELYPEGIRGFLYSGTGNAPFGISAVLVLTRVLALFLGKKTTGKFLNKILDGDYNKKFEHRTGSDWLSRDQDRVDRYAQDPLTQFIFTYGGYLDLFRLLRMVSRRGWYKKVPAATPVLLFSGDMDPVGNYGKDPRLIERRLKERGNADVTLLLYPEGRHEMLNELNRQDVYRDITNWCTKHIHSQMKGALV